MGSTVRYLTAQTEPSLQDSVIDKVYSVRLMPDYGISTDSLSFIVTGIADLPPLRLFKSLVMKFTGAIRALILDYRSSHLFTLAHLGLKC